jgi:hypothetical protein
MAYSIVPIKTTNTVPGPTIFTKSSFNAIDACKSLKKSIKGIGVYINN